MASGVINSIAEEECVLPSPTIMSLKDGTPAPPNTEIEAYETLDRGPSLAFLES